MSRKQSSKRMNIRRVPCSARIKQKSTGAISCVDGRNGSPASRPCHGFSRLGITSTTTTRRAFPFPAAGCRDIRSPGIEIATPRGRNGNRLSLAHAHAISVCIPSSRAFPSRARRSGAFSRNISRLSGCRWAARARFDK